MEKGRGKGRGKGGKCRALVADRVPLLTVSITRVTASPTSRVAADDASKLVRRLNEESRRPRRRPGGNYFLRGGSGGGGGGGGTALIAVSADSFCGVALMRCACPSVSVRPSVRRLLRKSFPAQITRRRSVVQSRSDSFTEFLSHRIKQQYTI